MIRPESAGYSNLPVYIKTILDFKSYFSLNYSESKIHWNLEDSIIIGRRFGITLLIPKLKRRLAIYTDKVEGKIIVKKTDYTLAG